MNASQVIYIVEDEALIAMELKDRLADLGYQICGHSARGEVALEEIPEKHPDLALMDINLAGRLNGIQTAGQLAGRADVPVVFLTAYADPALVAQAVETGPFGYLTKPFNMRTLHAAIQVAIHRHDREKELRDRHRHCEERCSQLEQSRAATE